MTTNILTAKQPLIMGVLNLTPDSFSDGGKFNSKKLCGCSWFRDGF